MLEILNILIGNTNKLNATAQQSSTKGENQEPPALYLQSKKKKNKENN